MGGSRVPKSERIGKVSVWFEARDVPPPPPPPPHATSARLAAPPIARALRIRNEVGVIAFPYQKLEARASSPPPSSRCLRGTTGARARRRRGGGPSAPLTPPPLVAGGGFNYSHRAMALGHR